MSIKWKLTKNGRKRIGCSVYFLSEEAYDNFTKLWYHESVYDVRTIYFYLQALQI